MVKTESFAVVYANIEIAKQNRPDATKFACSVFPMFKHCVPIRNEPSKESQYAVDVINPENISESLPHLFPFVLFCCKANNATLRSFGLCLLR